MVYNYRFLLLIPTLFVSTLLMGQITTSFTFGSIASSDNNLTSFSGPVLINNDSKCLTITNGVKVMEDRKDQTGSFNSTCKTTNEPVSVLFTASPNPAGLTTMVSATGIRDINQRYDLYLLDTKGEIVMRTNGKMVDFVNGKRVSFDNHAAGFYVIRVVTSTGTYSLKIIKTN